MTENLCDDAVAYLQEHRFLVPEKHDDAADVDHLRRVIRAVTRLHFDGYSHFTVLPTTDCNARCYYCYEKGIEKQSMDSKTAHDTAQYILNNRSPKADTIRLSWFGGEPLYNMAAIDRICEELRAASVKFRSGIISNGLLFDSATVEKAADRWNLDSAQITLDGTEKVYNRIKAYTAFRGNAFSQVMENIGHLLSAGIKVHIRLNVSEENIGDLDSLVSGLEYLKSSGECTVYTKLLFQYQSGHMAQRRQALLARQKELNARLAEMGLFSGNRDEKTFRIFGCMADDPGSVIIMPDGGLHACEHFSGYAPWGSIYESKTKMSARMPGRDGRPTSPSGYWSEEYPHESGCGSCRLYPFCIRLRHCSEEGGACKRDSENEVFEEIRRDMLRDYRKGV